MFLEATQVWFELHGYEQSARHRDDLLGGYRYQRCEAVPGNRGIYPKLPK